MREILFRGKTKAGEWVEGYFIKGTWYIDEKQIVAIAPLDLAFYPHCELSEYIEVIPESVGQFTGLNDKNGKRIFEGDIILFEDESPTNYEYHDCTEMRCGEIKFDEGEFYLTNRIAVEMGDLIYDGKLDGVIVSNIHDNPELLK